MTATLSPDEVKDLTGYTWPSRQLRELHRMGFWRARRCVVTGRVILERPHYESVSRGQDAKPSEAERPRLHRPIRPALRAV